MVAKFTASRLVGLLLKLRDTDQPGIKERLVAIDREIADLDARPAREEAEINEIIYGLYGLTDEEIQLVEGS